MDCPICGQVNFDKKHPYSVHKIKYADLIEKFYPKKDLLTGEKISFISIDQYELADFKDKRNLRKYLETNNKEIGLEYCKNWLIRRKNIKNLIYAPSQFELKTLQYPSIKFFHNFFGKNSYEKICNELSLILKYDYNQFIEIKKNKQLNFIIDSREQVILNLSNKQIQKLDVGDYTIQGSDIFIEKKSITDFCGTLSQHFERFNRELERCKINNKYLIILVEEKFSNIASIAYLPHTKKIKATSDFIFHQARTIINSYPLNCQIVCVNGKKEATNFVKMVFLLENNPKYIDFQYIIDMDKNLLNF